MRAGGNANHFSREPSISLWKDWGAHAIKVGIGSREGKFGVLQHFQRNLVAGVLTLIPIVVTYVVFNFLVRLLSGIGEPFVAALAGLVKEYAPPLASWVDRPFFTQILAIVIVILVVYLIGWAAAQVVGRRLLALFDRFMTHIPLVRQVYGSVKALINVLQTRPSGQIQRVVMIEFPHSEMKTIGFVTRTMRDEATGRELAAVFVPTTPNPTGGYLEIVPVDRLVSTDWTFDEAMNFVISGGAVARESIAYSKSTKASPRPPSND